MNPLITAISRPQAMATFSSKNWDEAIRFARNSRLLGYLHLLVARHELAEYLPVKVLEILEGARVYNSYFRLRAKRELRQIIRLFHEKDITVILLKGAAYIEAEISLYQGRRLSDVDLLVAEKDLKTAENIFLSAGYEYGEVSEYDQRYYREWMHEIPPLKHPARNFEVDLHRNLVPPVSRIKTDASKLIEQSIPIKNSFFRILEPKDMFLHSATHLFFNDELRGGLRDLVDMHEICQNYSLINDQSNEFWSQLVERACELEMQRLLYYALTSLQSIFNTEIPEKVLKDIEKYRPNWFVNYVMMVLIKRLIAPKNVEKMKTPIVQWLLFVRSHWIRMPFIMLIKHLTYKFQYDFKSNFIKSKKG